MKCIEELIVQLDDVLLDSNLIVLPTKRGGEWLSGNGFRVKHLKLGKELTESQRDTAESSAFRFSWRWLGCGRISRCGNSTLFRRLFGSMALFIGFLLLGPSLLPVIG